MRIELDLTDEEAENLRYIALVDAIKNGGDLNNKIVRAIESAESFVDDDNSGNKLVDCAGCGGTRQQYNSFDDVYFTCHVCNGTGKEYV